MATFEALSADAKRLERNAITNPAPVLPEDKGKRVSYSLAEDKPLAFSELAAEARRLEKVIAANQYKPTKE